MVVAHVQEIGQVKEASHKALPIPRTRETQLDVITGANGSPTSPPSSKSHQDLPEKNPELSFGGFGRLCQFKRVGDSVFRVFVWCWKFFGGITHLTGDA